MIDIILFGLAVASVYCVVMLFKIDNTDRNLSIITDAIHLHNMDVINSDDFKEEYLIDYDVYLDDDVMNRTLFRLFDWGYTNILPQDVYERIIPFLDEAERRFDQHYAKRK